MSKEIQYYPIEEAAAKRAKSMYSFSDYKHGTETAKYRDKVSEAYNLAREAAKHAAARADEAYRLADNYARQLANWLNRGFLIECQCPSSMICGPANFPTRRKEAQNIAREAHVAKYQSIEALLDKIKAISSTPQSIKLSDEDASIKLQAKINQLKARQEHMKVVNAYYRKYQTLEGCKFISVEKQKEIRPNTKPYANFALRNNLAAIKTCEQRLAGLTAAKDRGTKKQSISIEGKEVEVVENAEEMRIQFLFASKPSETVRTVLKRHAFKWSSRNSAWQRQLTNNARWAAQAVVDELV